LQLNPEALVSVFSHISRKNLCEILKNDSNVISACLEKSSGSLAKVVSFLDLDGLKDLLTDKNLES
jgi:hypothetical protein